MSDPTNLSLADRGRKRAAVRGRLFDNLANFRGPLDAKARRRLRAVIEAPSSETWEQAYSLVLRPEGLTLWQAVCVVDETFPATGPGSTNGRRNPWVRVPDQLTLVRAIRAAAEGRVSRVLALARKARESP